MTKNQVLETSVEQILPNRKRSQLHRLKGANVGARSVHVQVGFAFLELWFFLLVTQLYTDSFKMF